MTGTVNLASSLWLVRLWNLEENLPLLLSQTSVICNDVQNTHPYIHRKVSFLLLLKEAPFL